MENAEALATLKQRMRSAQAAWDLARNSGDSALAAATAKIAGRLEGEYRLAKMGRFTRKVPAGQVTCQHCGGYGGADQWPGFVCFECDGKGHTNPR